MSDDNMADLNDDLRPQDEMATIVRSAKVGRLTTQRGLILLIVNEGMDTELSLVMSTKAAREIGYPLIKNAVDEDKASAAMVGKIDKGVKATIVTPPKPKLILPH